MAFRSCSPSHGYEAAFTKKGAGLSQDDADEALS